jgi:signal transduction histidine kinase
MKLLDKLTIWFLVATFFVLITSGLIVFHSMQKEIDEEAVRRMSSIINFITKELEKGKSVKDLDGDQIEIRQIASRTPITPLTIKDTMAIFRTWQHALDRRLKLTSSHLINGKHYSISIYDNVAEPDEIRESVIKSLTWTFAILIIVITMTNRLISKRILAPFQALLEVLKKFSIKQRTPFELPTTSTYEFKTLNHFLIEMTAKAQTDYSALKEFTENASHEMQTPLAVIRGKLELLMESPLQEEQARLIFEAHHAVEKLSKVNHSLALLNKLENQEFEINKPVNFSQRLQIILGELSEVITLKEISLNTQIEDNVMVNLNETLADILMSNLISNAIRHNIEGGVINIQLTSSSLHIENSGNPPGVETAQLFNRFKKGNQSGESIGLGLAIVKQICTLGKMNVSYVFEKGMHMLKITGTFFHKI